jgi:hypothetical protein
VFSRVRDAKQSTEFSFSRFLVPFLQGFSGWALFMDCDVVVLDDISKLWALRDNRYAVMCVKHDHQPANTVKFLGEPQTTYPKKNWSSLMLLNCDQCTALTPDYVNNATGLELHQFKWLNSESLIGELPRIWNFLADYYKHDAEAKLVHYTDGGPYYKESRTVDYAADWFAMYEDANQCADSDVYELTDYSKRLARKLAPLINNTREAV